MRVSGRGDDSKGITRASPGSGDEVVLEVVVDSVVIGGRNAGTLTRIPGRPGPH